MSLSPGVLGWLRRRLIEPEPALVAIEVRPQTLGVVRRARDRPALAAAACLELPPGTLRLSMTEPNLVAPDAFRSALEGALARAGAIGGGRVALVLPDPVARLTLLPAEGLKGRRAEVEELIRFRLRKVVPFDVRQARVAAVPAAPGQLLVAAILESVLNEFEAACASLGLHAGRVELAGPALLPWVAPAGDRLLVNWDADYVSLLLLRDGAPILVRTLVGEAIASGDQVAREASNTLLYYRERLGGGSLAGVSVRLAGASPEPALAALAEALGSVPERIDPWRGEAAAASLPDAAALAGAAACVLGRAA